MCRAPSPAAAVDADFWKSLRFFRVAPGFVVQWGIHGKPSVAAEWRDKKIEDDPQKPGISNKRGFITFAKAGPNTRTTQGALPPVARRTGALRRPPRSAPCRSDGGSRAADRGGRSVRELRR